MRRYLLNHRVRCNAGREIRLVIVNYRVYLVVYYSPLLTLKYYWSFMLERDAFRWV